MVIWYVCHMYIFTNPDTGTYHNACRGFSAPERQESTSPIKGIDLERGNHHVDNYSDCCSPGGYCRSAYCPLDTSLFAEETRGAKTGMGTGPGKAPARLDVTARETRC